MRTIENVIRFLEELKKLQEKYGLALVCDDPYCSLYGGVCDAVEDYNKDIDYLIKSAIKNDEIWYCGRSTHSEPIEKK